MSESSSAIPNGLEVLGVGVLVGLLDSPESHAWDWVPQRQKKAFDAFPWGGLTTERCGGHASKQAGKALRSKGHPHRTKRSRILATLKENEGMYKTHQVMHRGGLGHGPR